MARTLPGSVITAGIDCMVAVIRALNPADEHGGEVGRANHGDRRVW
jgi:hypothetical protein